MLAVFSARARMGARATGCHYKQTHNKQVEATTAKEER